MLANCSKCDCFITRYLMDTWFDPCPNCGCYIFKVTILDFDEGLHYKGQHQEISDMRESKKEYEQK